MHAMRASSLPLPKSIQSLQEFASLCLNAFHPFLEFLLALTGLPLASRTSLISDFIDRRLIRLTMQVATVPATWAIALRLLGRVVVVVAIASSLTCLPVLGRRVC